MLVIIGWVGALGLLIAFVLSSLGKLDNRGSLYHTINLISAILLIVNAYYSEAYPFFVINIFWSLTSTYSLFKNIYLKEKISA